MTSPNPVQANQANFTNNASGEISDLNLSQLKDLIVRNQKLLDEKQFPLKLDKITSNYSNESTVDESAISTTPTKSSIDSKSTIHLENLNLNAKLEKKTKNINKISNKKRSRPQFVFQTREDLPEKVKINNKSLFRFHINSENESSIPSIDSNSELFEFEEMQRLKSKRQVLSTNKALNKYNPIKSKRRYSFGSIESLNNLSNESRIIPIKKKKIIEKTRPVSADGIRSKNNIDLNLISKIDERLQYLEQLKTIDKNNFNKNLRKISQNTIQQYTVDFNELFSQRRSIMKTPIINEEITSNHEDENNYNKNYIIKINNLEQHIISLQEILVSEREERNKDKTQFEYKISKLLDHIERLEISLSEMQKDHNNMFAIVRKYQDQQSRIDDIDDLLSIKNNEFKELKNTINRNEIAFETKLDSINSKCQISDERSKQNEFHELRHSNEIADLNQQIISITQKVGTLIQNQNLMKEQWKLIMMNKSQNKFQEIISPFKNSTQMKNLYKSNTKPIKLIKKNEVETRYEKLLKAYNRIFGENDSILE